MRLRNEQNAHSVRNRQPDGAPGSFLNFSSHLWSFNSSAETQVINVRFLLATSQSGGPIPASTCHLGLLCAQGGRSDEHRSFSRADIPLWAAASLPLLQRVLLFKTIGQCKNIGEPCP
jgi:hypothetical protein